MTRNLAHCLQHARIELSTPVSFAVSAAICFLISSTIWRRSAAISLSDEASHVRPDRANTVNSARIDGTLYLQRGARISCGRAPAKAEYRDAGSDIPGTVMTTPPIIAPQQNNP